MCVVFVLRDGHDRDLLLRDLLIEGAIRILIDAWQVHKAAVTLRRAGARSGALIREVSLQLDS
jgi:hypothetical protein